MVVSAICCIAARGQPNPHVKWLTSTESGIRNVSSSVEHRDANFNRRTSPRLRTDVKLPLNGFQPFFHDGRRIAPRRAKNGAVNCYRRKAVI